MIPRRASGVSEVDPVEVGRRVGGDRWYFIRLV